MADIEKPVRLVIGSGLPKDAPLKCEVEGDRLVVSIGVAVLAAAIRLSPEFDSDEGPRITVKDTVAFAKAMARQFSDQCDESGETALTRLLIKAANDLVEAGDLSVDYRD